MMTPMPAVASDSLSADATAGDYDPAAGVWSVGALPVGGTETLVLRAKATQKRPHYVPGKIESKRSSGLAGFTLAGANDAQLNRRLALYCSLQLS